MDETVKFNYFCTFTYDLAKMSEDEFRRKLTCFLRNRATRNDWIYIGVWERSPEKNRLHFHCLLKAPESSIPGHFTKQRIWSPEAKKMKMCYSNDYILSCFGVNDFSPIDDEDKDEYLSIVHYFLKSIEKSGEKIVYFHGLKQFKQLI